MLRRLGQNGYRAESPQEYSDSISISMQSDISTPSVDYDQENHHLSFMSLTMDSERACTPRESKEAEQARENRVVEKDEFAIIIANVCRKLDTIVNLMSDFTSDALGLRENAEDLLLELRGKVLPYLMNLDTDMSLSETLLRYNIDCSNINENRIDWLLMYNKYQMELRRVLNELATTVYEDLEDSLELRYRGVLARRPCSETMENLNEMKRGMQRAVQLLCSQKRGTA